MTHLHADPPKLYDHRGPAAVFVQLPVYNNSHHQTPTLERRLWVLVVPRLPRPGGHRATHGLLELTQQSQREAGFDSFHMGS